MTTRERADAVRAAAAEIDAAIVAKGGTTPGGLRNAAAAIAALPSGGDIDEYLDFYEGVIRDVNNFRVPDGFKTIYGDIFNRSAQGGSNIIGTIDLSGVEKVKDSAFNVQEKITSVYAPDALSFGNYAFSSCSHIANIYAPNVLSIGSACFDFANGWGNIADEWSFPSCTFVDGIAFRGLNVRTLKLNAITDGSRIVNTATFSNAKMNDIYLEGIDYEISNPPKGFPWGANKEGCSFHFKGGVIVRLVSGVWTIVES